LIINSQRIAQEATEKLTRLTGIELHFQPDPKDQDDGQLIIGEKLAQKPEALQVEIKNEVRMIPPGLPRHFKNSNSILIANYITAPVKEKLKENNINYLDIAGNCFIKTGRVFLYINDQKITESRNKPNGKLWTPTGLKFIWSVLQTPAVLNEPYRAQATIAGVALGLVGDLLQELQGAGYILRNREGNYFLQQQQALQNRWIELYALVLRPKLVLGKYRLAGKQVHQAHLPNNMLWGGEAAAARMFSYLEPETYPIYTWQDKRDTMKQLRLVPDPTGPFELLEGFWQRQEKNQQQLIPPMMVYAELLATGDSRNLEAAERLKAIYPAWKI
jgi:hypothetical protein